MQKLTATAVKQTKPRESSYKMTDGGGLFLLVKPQGKYWRYDYRFAGKRKTLALGVYPDVSLADARKSHLIAREQIAAGIDPSEAKKIKRMTKNLVTSDSFEAIAREWFNQKMSSMSDGLKNRLINRSMSVK